MPSYPVKPAYLFYGNQVEDILKARDQVLEMVLSPEARNENLTEYYPTEKSDTLKLASILDEIAGDLATLSFIPEAAKCVIVTNPAELIGRGGGRGGGRAKAAAKGKRPEERITRWLQQELPQTEYHLILLAFEDEAAQREVQESGTLYKVLNQVGYVQAFKDKKAFFRIEDALLSRNAPVLIAAIRDLWKPGRGDMAVYNCVLRSLRYLIQANIARDPRLRDDPARLNTFLPPEPQRNILKASPYAQKKYMRRLIFRTRDLLEAYRGLLDVYRALRPRPGDLYVPDARGLLEQTLLRLIGSSRS